MSLQLDSLKDPEFWKDKSNEETGEIPFIVILPSGRAADATCGHLALVSDALYTHEIIVKINNTTLSGGLKGLNVKSMLDIDYYDDLVRERQNSQSNCINEKDSFMNSNLLVLATADINIISKLLLHESNAIEQYKMGYRKPYEDCIILGAKGNTYAVMAYPNVGVLSLFQVPWSTYNRVAIFCGGILAPGTLAANKLLVNYLDGRASGNNSHDGEVPLRIVSSTVRDYSHVQLYPTASCIPQHELRNITSDILIHE